MRIATIAPSSVPSNTAHSIQVMKVCSALARGKGGVALWIPGEKSTSWNEVSTYYGIDTEFDIRWIRSRQTMRRLDFTVSALHAAKTWGADLIYTWMVQAAVAGLWMGYPVVLELHDRPTGRFGPLWLRTFAGQTGQKRILFITSALRRVVDEEFNIRFPDYQMKIAPNGCDLEHHLANPSAKDARAELGLRDQLTAVYSGHFYSGRGTDILLALARAFPQVQFIWVGGRPDHVSLLRNQLAEQRVDNVVLTGFVENQNLPMYQAAADILLMPYGRNIAGSGGGNSADICSPMKMFDYLAAGRAILSSDLPVIHEVLNSSNSMFCPPDDPDAWIMAFGDLLQNPWKISQLGEQARIDANLYTWDRRVDISLDGFPPDGTNGGLNE